MFCYRKIRLFFLANMKKSMWASAQTQQAEVKQCSTSLSGSKLVDSLHPVSSSLRLCHVRCVQSIFCFCAFSALSFLFFPLNSFSITHASYTYWLTSFLAHPFFLVEIQTCFCIWCACVGACVRSCLFACVRSCVLLRLYARSYDCWCNS